MMTILGAILIGLSLALLTKFVVAMNTDVKKHKTRFVAAFFSEITHGAGLVYFVLIITGLLMVLWGQGFI